MRKTDRYLPNRLPPTKSRLPGDKWLGRELRATLLLAYPLMLTNVALTLIPTTDVVLLGWSSPRALAAGVLGVNLYNGCMVFGSGLVSATAPMIARSLGRRSYEVREVRRTVRQAFLVAIVVVIPIWMLLWNTKPVLIFLGQDAHLAADASNLTRPMMFGILPLFVYQILRSFMTALGRPGWTLSIAAFAVLSNALINYGLMFGHFGLPQLGLAGVGLGSAISNVILAAGLATIVVLDRRFRRYRLFAYPLSFDWPRFRSIWRLGLPIGATLAMETTCFNAAVILMGLIGETELAAHAIAIQIVNLCFQLPSALGQTATVRVGRAYGRGSPVDVSRAGWAALVATMALMICIGGAILIAPGSVVSLFLGSVGTHDRVFALATDFLIVAAVFQIADGAQAVSAGMLRGIHDADVPMVIAAFGYWFIGIGTAALFAFPLRWGGEGIWFGLAAGLVTTASCLVVRWAYRDSTRSFKCRMAQ